MRLTVGVTGARNEQYAFMRAVKFLLDLFYVISLRCLYWVGVRRWAS